MHAVIGAEPMGRWAAIRLRLAAPVLSELARFPPGAAFGIELRGCGEGAWLIRATSEIWRQRRGPPVKPARSGYQRRPDASGGFDIGAAKQEHRSARAACASS
jgi:hypothetical protein